ncbi:phosphoribosylamine--glycine ligase [Lentibacillus sp. L22]|uniref:phosphoribosylamine--glycine ligase n=1 Tax=Lentibacillus TaxID=175304 RepID=UPI0022B0D67F|nr:phosphoribosylamine--glycine ligase [Lentibacillus daqui]
MNILVVGRGGREHSIVMKLAASEQVTNLYAAPGNGGIAQQATCVDIDEMDIDRLIMFARDKQIDLTIVGPENPLNAGIANRFQEVGLAIFAPTKEAALLEGSKQFAKQFMGKYNIPTAAHATFADAKQAKQYIIEQGAPIVVKADGLAAGKGVVVAETEAQAIKAVDDMLISRTFAEAGATLVIEECLVGKEFSLMAFVHEGNVYPMLPARDHKRAFDHDKGPNTGGMGAYAPVPDVTDEDLAYTYREILKKTADGLVNERRPFTGILYAGLMMTADGPKVIEFNTRFGDPETQVVLPLLKNDLLQVILDVIHGRNPTLTWEENFCAGVVVAAQGYPDSYEKGITLPDIVTDEHVFVVHAGTKLAAGSYQSDGGRVLLVGSKQETLDGAANHVYHTLTTTNLSDQFFYRSDIGKLTTRTI